MVKYGFGVDIGGTTCKLGLFSLEGELLEKWEIPTDTADGGVGILSDVADAVEQKLKERQIPRDEVLGIGLDAPGAIGEDGVVSQAVNLGWRQYPARDVLSQRMNMKVRICNDANAVGLPGYGYGNAWHGRRRRSDCRRESNWRGAWHRRRDWTYDRLCRGDRAVRLRQIWLSGAVCFRKRIGSCDEMSFGKEKPPHHPVGHAGT